MTSNGSTEAATSRQRQTTTAVEARFLRWFRASGGTLDARCRIQPIEGMGRGMVALAPISANSTIFTIPRHLLLNLNTTALGAAIEASGDEAAKQQWKQLLTRGWLPLILAMLWERRRAGINNPAPPSGDGDVSMEDLNVFASARSEIDRDEGTDDPEHPYAKAPRPQGEQQWGPYFDIMPTEFTTPMFWPAEDIGHLEGTSIVDKIARSQAEEDYHTHLLPLVKACPAVFGSDPDEWYDLNSYHIMGSRILSRSFHVKSRKRGREGEAVDMDERLDDDETGDEEEAVGDVMDDEQEGEEEAVADEEEQQADGDETRDTLDAASDAGSDDDDDDEDEDEDEEEEQEQVSDISMTPMADMLNARFESDNARLFYKAHCLCMRTTKDVAAGAQIFNTYADPPNSDLLRRYGHVDEPNGSDVVELPSDLVVEAAAALVATRTQATDEAARQAIAADMAERREWACSALGIEEVYILSYLFPPSAKPPHRPEPERPTAKQLKSAATGGGIDEELIALARILGMTRASFEKAKQKGKGPSARIESVEAHGAKGEIKIETARIMIDALSLRLAQLPGGKDTKAEEALLYPATGTAQREVPQNERRALVVRLGEKRVLLDQKRTVQYVLERIEEDEKEREKKQKQREKEKRKAEASSGKGGGKKVRR